MQPKRPNPIVNNRLQPACYLTCNCKTMLSFIVWFVDPLDHERDEFPITVWAADQQQAVAFARREVPPRCYIIRIFEAKPPVDPAPIPA